MKITKNVARICAHIHRQSFEGNHVLDVYMHFKNGNHGRLLTELPILMIKQVLKKFISAANHLENADSITYDHLKNCFSISSF
jgi:hypothetical protein